MGRTLYDFVQADTNSVIRVTIRNQQSKTVIDLTSSTVRFVFSIDGGTVKSPTMTILSPATAGIVEYQFVTGDLTPGLMTAAIEITFADTTILSQLDTFTFNVRAKII